MYDSSLRGEVEHMDYKTIIYDKPEEGIARITFNRPEAMNALSLQLIDELYEAADEAVRACMNGASVLPGLPKICCTPAS